MKQKKVCFLIAVAASTAVFVHKKTKRIQAKARSMGRYIPYGPYEAVFKRPLDILMSGVAIILLLPVFGVVALMVRFKLGSPILFKQQRPGLNGKIFTIYKFRTMTDEKDENGELLPDGQRLTKFGKWLRSTSLDELPELFNILNGDMSIVGPRPLLVEYLPRYNEKQRRRHDVMPGLTGFAQVSGRNGIGWEEKFEDDLGYVDKITFIGDMKIILDTVKVVFKREGIDGAGAATVNYFTGNRCVR